MQFTTDRPIKGIAFSVDGDSILLYPKDGTEPYRTLWSSDQYWKRACDYLSELGVSGELGEGSQSYEFRMFKGLLNEVPPQIR